MKMKKKKRALSLLFAVMMLIGCISFVFSDDKTEDAKVPGTAIAPMVQQLPYAYPLMSYNIFKEYENGTIYYHPNWTCLYYVPHNTDETTTFMLYYCGGGMGEDYIWYDGLYKYFTVYNPNTVMIFVRESGYNHIYQKNEDMAAVIFQLADELGIPEIRLSVSGSSAGAYTALKAIPQFYDNYGIKMTAAATLDTGMEWEDDLIHNLTSDECDTVAKVGTVLYLFEQPNTCIYGEVMAVNRLVQAGANVCVVGCLHKSHNDISMYAWINGIFSMISGNDIPLDTEEYTETWLNNM